MTVWTLPMRLRSAQEQIAHLQRDMYVCGKELTRLTAECAAWRVRADDADRTIRSLRDRLARADSVVIAQLRRELALQRDLVAALEERLIRSQREVEHWERTHGACERARQRIEISDDTTSRTGMTA